MFPVQFSQISPLAYESIHTVTLISSQFLRKKADVVLGRRGIPADGYHRKHVRESLAVFLKVRHLDRHLPIRLYGAAHLAQSALLDVPPRC